MLKQRHKKLYALLWGILLPTLIALFPSIADADVKGFNFRDTAGYCTDPANTTYWLVTTGAGGDNYPTTRNGIDFGTYPSGSVGDNRRDRTAAIDCRLAGVTFKANDAATPNTLRVDLPATGDYVFCLAMGDAFNTGTNQKVQVFDDAAGFTAITDASTVGGAFVDATGVERTSAGDWVTNNACVTYTFTTQIAYIKYGVGDGVTAGNTFLAHFSLDEVATATTTTTVATTTSTTVVTTTSTLTTTTIASSADNELCGDGIDDSLATGGPASGTKGSCPANYHDAYIGLGCDADCDAPDKDLDGYTTDGSVGIAGSTAIDCDDTNPGIYPGRPVDVSGTGYKLCQAAGTYSATILNAATPLCESPLGPTHCFYINFASGNDTTGTGSWAAPWASTAKISGGSGASGLPASPHTLVAGDHVYIVGSGTNSTTFTSTEGSSALFQTNSDGTLGLEWVIHQYPGATGVFSNTNGFGLISNGSYGKFDGLIGSSARTSAANASFFYGHGTHHIEIKNSYVTGINGQGDNNDACIYYNGTHDTNFHNNFLRDCKRQTGNVQNLWALTWLDETATADGANHRGFLNTIWHQTFSSTANGGGIRTKHGVIDSETGADGHIVAFNSIVNVGYSGMVWSSSGMRAYGNRFLLDDGVYAITLLTGNGVRHEDNRFQYNTMIAGLSGLNWRFPYYSAPEHLDFDHNVIVAIPSAYLAGNGEGIIAIDPYGSDANKLDMDAGMLDSDNNCLYSPNATAVYDYYHFVLGDGGTGPAGNAGARYSAAQWQSIVGQDAASMFTTCGISGPKHKATGGASTYGWNNALAALGGGGTTTTTSVATTTTTTTATTTVATTTTTSVPGAQVPLQAMGAD